MPTTKLTSTGLQFYDDSGNLVSTFAFDTSTGDLSHDKEIQATQFVTSAASSSTGSIATFTITVQGTSSFDVDEELSLYAPELRCRPRVLCCRAAIRRASRAP